MSVQVEPGNPTYHLRAYSELAWTESILASVEEAAGDVERLISAIKEYSRIPVLSLLHLGCGAGAYDYTFKRHLSVTGVDISSGMLEIAKARNPEVTYVAGDMRDIELNTLFDAVAIPDSIGYMTTIDDLRAAIQTACRHLKPGGVLLIVALMREEFRENNFVYSGSTEGTTVTVFENNCIPDTDRPVYEATLVYLIRRQGNLEIVTDCHTQGLFPKATWLALLKEEALDVQQMQLTHSYDRYLIGEGPYHLRVFICRKHV